jgi:hypothetical protein
LDKVLEILNIKSINFNGLKMSAEKKSKKKLSRRELKRLKRKPTPEQIIQYKEESIKRLLEGTAEMVVKFPDSGAAAAKTISSTQLFGFWGMH